MKTTAVPLLTTTKFRTSCGARAMRIVTLDTESTGVGPEDQMVEIGLVFRDLTCSASLFTWSTLVKPTVPVQPGARAAHHITDKELSTAPTAAKVISQLKKHLARVNVITGHNLEFDVRIMMQSGVPEEILPELRICTWRCARHLWPDAPAYGNQTLRYWQALDVDPKGLPHRALPDAVVTDALLERMLESHAPDRLIELTSTPVLQTKINFGKHRGKLWSEVNIDYCKWLVHPHRQPPFNEEVRYAAQHWIKVHEEKKKVTDQGVASPSVSGGVGAQKGDLRAP